MNNKAYIMLTESQVKRVIDKIVLEQSDLGEYGKKGRWKESWNADDHALAMYNSVYGVEDLGFSKEEIANKVIGSSVSSLIQQSLNFDFLSGKIDTYDREHKLQPEIYKKFKGIPHQDFKNYCLNIIEYRYEHPEESVKKFELGKLIGDKRDEASIERRTKLADAGVNMDRATMINQRPKFEPTPEEEEEEPTDIQPQSPRKNTPKDEIGGFLKSLYMKAMESNPELADDIQFISDYIDSELVDKEMLSEIRKLFKPHLMENTFKVKKSDIKNIVEKIIT